MKHASHRPGYARSSARVGTLVGALVVTPLVAGGCLVSLGSDDASPAPPYVVPGPSVAPFDGSAQSVDAAHRSDAANGDGAVADGSSNSVDDASSDASGVFADAAVDASTDAAPGCTLTSCGARAVCIAGACVLARRAFVSSATYAATLGGHAGADATCQSLAGAAGLGGVWMAWISDGASSPSARFDRASYAYRLLDGTTVAASYASLVGGSLAHAIDRDEHQKPVSGTTEVWTATSTDGTLFAAGCNGFTSSLHSAPIVAEGISGNTDGTWTDVYQQFCDRSAHLYCIEQ